MQNYTIRFRAMGSAIQVWLNCEESTAMHLLPQVPSAFAGWEAVLSRFRVESELNQLNAQAGQWVRASATLLENVQLARQSAEMTGGLVNPLVLNALEAAGYDHSFTGDTYVPDADRTQTAIVGDWQDIDIDSTRKRLRIPAGSRLDLGGTAKGWAAQETAKWLSHFGPCLVDAGGDMVARGTPDDSGGWMVKLPVGDESVLLTDAAIATSGTDYRHWQHHGKAQHHLIDPRTGLPAQTDIMTATVIASDAIHAEAWAKATLISGKAVSTLPTLIVYSDHTSQFNVSNSELIRRDYHVQA